MRKAVAIILGLEALVLVFAVVVFLAGENDGVEMPKTVPASPVLTKPLKISVPVSVDLGATGIVRTALVKQRGGEATTATSANATSSTATIGTSRGSISASTGLAGGNGRRG